MREEHTITADTYCSTHAHCRNAQHTLCPPLFCSCADTHMHTILIKFQQFEYYSNEPWSVLVQFHHWLVWDFTAFNLIKAGQTWSLPKSLALNGVKTACVSRCVCVCVLDSQHGSVFKWVKIKRCDFVFPCVRARHGSRVHRQNVHQGCILYVCLLWVYLCTI